MRNTILFTLAMVLLSSSAFAKPVVYRVLPEEGAFLVHDNNCGENVDANHAMYVSNDTVIKVDDVMEFMSLEFKVPSTKKSEKKNDERIASLTVFGDSEPDLYATPRPGGHKPKSGLKRPARGFWQFDKVVWRISIFVGAEVNGKTPIDINFTKPTSPTNNAQRCFDRWRGFAQKEKQP